MKKTNDRKMRIHIVHSVKGGSGKTAYSLLKSINLAKVSEKEKADSNQKQVLYLDADFKGTAIKTLIYGKGPTEFEGFKDEHMPSDYLMSSQVCTVDFLSGSFVFDNEYVENTLNDYLIASNMHIHDIIVKGGFCGYSKGGSHSMVDSVAELGMPDSGLIGKIDFIFSSPNVESKNLFLHGSDGVEMPELAIGIYAKKMRRLFDEIKASGYTDIVIDMLPGEDEYSHELLKIINEENRNKNVCVYFYSITTIDLTHIDAEYEDLAYMLRPKSNRQPYDRYIVVFNELQKDEFTWSETTNDIIEKYRDDLREKLENRRSTYLNRVFYTRCAFKQTYYEFCRKAKKRGFEYLLEEKLSDIWGKEVEDE